MEYSRWLKVTAVKEGEQGFSAVPGVRIGVNEASAVTTYAAGKGAPPPALDRAKWKAPDQFDILCSIERPAFRAKNANEGRVLQPNEVVHFTTGMLNIYFGTCQADSCDRDEVYTTGERLDQPFNGAHGYSEATNVDNRHTIRHLSYNLVYLSSCVN